MFLSLSFEIHTSNTYTSLDFLVGRLCLQPFKFAMKQIILRFLLFLMFYTTHQVNKSRKVLFVNNLTTQKTITQESPRKLKQIGDRVYGKCVYIQCCSPVLRTKFKSRQSKSKSLHFCILESYCPLD